MAVVELSEVKIVTRSRLTRMVAKLTFLITLPAAIVWMLLQSGALSELIPDFGGFAVAVMIAAFVYVSGAILAFLSILLLSNYFCAFLFDKGIVDIKHKRMVSLIKTLVPVLIVMPVGIVQLDNPILQWMVGLIIVVIAIALVLRVRSEPPAIEA